MVDITRFDVQPGLRPSTTVWEEGPQYHIELLVHVLLEEPENWFTGILRE